MNALLAQFIPEARELLEQAGAGMLALERDAGSPRVINDVFRAVHTLKGSSGLFDVAPLTRLVHAAEDLLGEVRTGELALNSEIVDRLLDSLDVTGRWIDALEAREQLPGDAEATMTERVAVLRGWLAHRPAASVATTGRPVSGAPPAWLADMSESDRIAAYAAASGGPLLAWSFDPEEDCFFRGDDPVAMLGHAPGLLALRVTSRAPLPGLDALDPLTCLLRFEAVSDAPREAIEEHMRYVADRIVIDQIEPRDLAIPTGTPAKRPLFGDFARLARKHLAAEDGDALARAAATLLSMVAPASVQASALRWCAAHLARHGIDRRQDLEALVDAVETGLRPVWFEPRAPEPAQAQAAVAATGQAGDLEPVRALVASLASEPAIDPAAAVVAARAAIVIAPSPADPAVERKAIPRVLRVDLSKIEAIMSLVAELIVAKNGLSYLAARAEQVHGSRALAREIRDRFAVIDRITQGLQSGVMSVRMMPVSQVLQRFPRLVRDIARKLGKTIELVIEGEDTEADKNVLDSLADPLIHMIRNSLDHGIETPAERSAAGKPEPGVLRISARQENDFVVIEVADDGRGIDPRGVRARSVQLGLVSAEQAEQMGDEDATNLVFAAGFSTRDEISDLSGRGVGMDVVRSAVLKAGGDVSLRTTLGAGTSVTVRLPLTMAVTRIVTIDCGGRTFGIPMNLVVETVKIKRADIHRIKDTESFVLRDAIIPILRLARRLGLVDDESPRHEEAVMVVRIGRERLGLVVGGFRERLEAIVSPFEGVLEGMAGFSGTALLGDGAVLLILDLQELV
ncbi:MAG: chemotaxis protein CheA [Roseiarcus sp.]|jgi:two-component system chemotaxis sensor kinase CheA